MSEQSVIPGERPHDHQYGNPSFINDDDTEELYEVDHVEYNDTTSADSDRETRRCSRLCCAQEYVTVAILVCINLLNYMDRYTLPAVQKQLADFYSIDNSRFGLLQTSFVCSYMIFSPLFGFLGDRYNRKFLMCIGLFFWSLITAASSFVPKQYYGLFLTARALVGIGEASYSTVAPTIFGDLFERNARSKALAVFYFAIPVGSGLGYIVGSVAFQISGNWVWALRVTPILGTLFLILTIFFVEDPPRGQAVGGARLHATSYWADIRYLFTNKSYLFTCFGFTCVSYVAGALAWWAPRFFYNAWRLQTSGKGGSLEQVSLVFGAITCVAGVGGVLIGSETARRLRPRIQHVDAVVCGVGLLASTPFVFFSLIVSEFSIYATFVLVLIGELLVCLNWSLVVDIMLSVVIPTRQATASGIQNLIAHSLGDAGSPWIVGMISDGLRKQFSPDHPESISANFYSLQYALYTTAIVAAIGGGFFLVVALTYRRDRARFLQIISETTEDTSRGNDEPSAQQGVDFTDDAPIIQRPDTQLNTRNLIT